MSATLLTKFCSQDLYTLIIIYMWITYLVSMLKTLNYFFMSCLRTCLSLHTSLSFCGLPKILCYNRAINNLWGKWSLFGSDKTKFSDHYYDMILSPLILHTALIQQKCLGFTVLDKQCKSFSLIQHPPPTFSCSY